MKFGTKGKEIQTKTSQYINYGVQELKINSMEIVKASTGTERVQFNMESQPVDEDGYEGLEGAKGKVGRITSGWLKTDDQQSEFNDRIVALATKMGVKEEVDAIEASTLEEYVTAVSPILCNKFARLKVTAEEYAKADGNIGYSLAFARFNFVESLDDDAKLTFDKEDKYDYKRLPEMDALTGTEEPKDALPF